MHLQTSCKVPHLFQERQRMSDRLEDTSLRLKDEMDLYKRMMDKLRQNRLEFNKEREATQEVGMRNVVRPGNCILSAWKLIWKSTGVQDEHWKYNIWRMYCRIVHLWQGCPQDDECCKST